MVRQQNCRWRESGADRGLVGDGTLCRVSTMPLPRQEFCWWWELLHHQLLVWYSLMSQATRIFQENLPECHFHRNRRLNEFLTGSESSTSDDGWWRGQQLSSFSMSAARLSRRVNSKLPTHHQHCRFRVDTCSTRDHLPHWSRGKERERGVTLARYDDNRQRLLSIHPICYPISTLMAPFEHEMEAHNLICCP